MRLRRGHTLVATLAVIGIIALLAVVFMKGSGAFGTQKSSRADGRGTTVPGLVKAKAQDEVCKSNLNQVRLAIEVQRSSNADEAGPQSLEETRLGPDYYRCPMGKEPYVYNPQTGEVHCTHPGHEKY